MKITKIQVYLLEKQLSASMQISRGGFQIRQHTIVEVTTDEGIVGLGEAIGNAKLTKAILDGWMVDLAIGENPMQIEALRTKLMDSQVYFERKGSALCAASAIEMACWDIKGKALNVPVYELLGGKCREEIEVYASDCYWEEDPQNMANHVKKLVERGINAVKAHIGARPPREDIRRVEVLREALGKDIRLMIDLNAGYNAFDALEASRLWAPYDITWLEEPLNPNYVDALANLRNRSMIPIATGENEFQIHGFKELLERQAVDVIMPDIGRVGGIQETKNICVLAESYGVPVSPHNYSSGILLAATIHLMASTPNTMWLEMDMSQNAVYEELLCEPLQFNNSCITIPQCVGLGVQLPSETLKNYLIKS